MRSADQLSRCVVFVLLFFVLASPGLRAAQDWTDTNKTTFRADPVEVLGPFALFRTSAFGGKRVLLRGLNPADCQRFYEAIKSRPARANSFAQAKGKVTGELIGRVARVQADKLVPANLSGEPEPQLVVVLYGYQGEGEAWSMIHNYEAVYRRARAVYPGLTETVFFGVRHDAAGQRHMATQTWMPWLVADFATQSSMSFLNQYRPKEGAWAGIFSRDGALLLLMQISDLASSRKFADELNELLQQLNPTNPKFWPDRLHYEQAVRPLEFAQQETGPKLIGDPLRPETLRENGIEKVSARLSIAADGAVTNVLWLPDSQFPEAHRPALTGALQRVARFAPALRQGTAVPASFDYTTEPASSGATASDRIWLSGSLRQEILLAKWLVLKPVAVTKDDFFEVAYIDPLTGKAIAKPIEVSAEGKLSRRKQMNAFNSDFFADKGAVSVAPQPGDPQLVDGKQLKWQLIETKDGYVDLQDANQMDYTIGYAWTDIEVPADVDAWLGIGSDDGLKIWLNGELIHDKWIRRLSRIDDDIVPLKLKKGHNALLMKIQNANGDWSFVTRVRAR